jgi:hypothetical protein
MQEVDAARRAAILRGQTPPLLPAKDTDKGELEVSRREGHERKRRKLAGEDDTDMDIRLATSTALKEDDYDAKVLKMRKPALDAPLTDRTGHIDLFPVDHKEAMKRQKNEEAEREKKKKEQSFEEQYTMRFSNAAGRGGLENPWYASGGKNAEEHKGNAGDKALEYPGLESKDVWGNEDPRRKEREKARITSSDPFAFMQKAQIQLKKSKVDRQKWKDERERELWELRAAQERETRRERHKKRKKRAEDDEDDFRGHRREHGRHRSSELKHRYRSRSRSPERRTGHGSSHRHERNRSRSGERAYMDSRESNQKASRRHERVSPMHARTERYEPHAY